MPQYQYGPEGIDEGAEGEDFNTMGAAAPRRPVRRAAVGGIRVYPQPPLPQIPAQPHRSKLRSFLGMGTLHWGPAESADKLLNVAPQESFRGERLIIDVSTKSGPAAGLVLLRSVVVGTQPQSPSLSQSAPASMFSAQATYSRLDMQVAFRAMELQVTLGLSEAPGGAAEITAAVGFYGEWIR